MIADSAESITQSTRAGGTSKPAKPRPDFPLLPHATGRWAKKIKGKSYYFGTWDDPEGAQREYEAFLAGTPRTRPTREANGKPAKPYPEFPLFAHANGRWAKKIRGRLVYFGPWGDPQGAVNNYLAQKDDLHAGRTPRPLEGELTLRELANRFLSAKRALVDSGEITARTWADYYSSCSRLLKGLGKDRLVADLHGDDFESYRARLARKWGPVPVGNEIQRVRSVFKYAFDSDLIDRPVKFGPGFKRPSKKTLRQHRAKKGKRMFEADELRQVLNAAGQPMKAMILLAINCGFGNADIGTLPIKSLDLENGWIDYPRPKTGVERRSKLWPETIEAVKEWLPIRPKSRERRHECMLFITRRGDSWHNVVVTERLNDKVVSPSVSDPIAAELGKVLRKAKLKRPGLNFYALRHTFETVAGASKDQVAVDHVMGHARDDMASHYRERIGDDRLEDVARVVRGWLFPAQPASGENEILSYPSAKAN